MNATIEQLIDDTLHGRRIAGKDNSCMVSNEAGSELVKHAGYIVPELEATIFEVDSSLRDQSARVGGFAGLEYLLGAYLVNAARYDAMRAVEFIELLCPELVRQFIANMPVFFRQMDAGYNFDVALPEEYMQLAIKISNSTNDEMASTAARVVNRLSR